MEKSTDSWTSFDGVDRESEHGRKIDQVLETADFDSLCGAALKLRQKSSASPDSSLTCSTDKARFTSGYHHVVFALDFSDSVRWIARVRLPWDEPTQTQEVETAMTSEVATLRVVAARTTIPVPQVYGFDAQATNAFGYRYVLMQALPGRQMDARLSKTVPRASWDKVTEQLADYSFQLSRLAFGRVGRLWCGPNGDEPPSIIAALDFGETYQTSLEYFYAVRRNHRRWVQAEHPNDDEWATASWILEQALPMMIVEEFVKGPFPLCHMDFHFGNILLADDYTITGIVDWSQAQTVPRERFIITPEFVTFPGRSAEENESIRTFRDKFQSALRRREASDRDKQRREGTISKPFIAELLGTPLWEVVYRANYSLPWRALSDARLILRQVYGPSAKWEDFVTYYQQSPMHCKALQEQE